MDKVATHAGENKNIRSRYVENTRRVAWHADARTHSADAEPLVPAEKLSTKRTQLCSNGTVVPPD